MKNLVFLENNISFRQADKHCRNEQLPDEAGVIDMYKCSHQQLAVKAIHKTAVTRNRVTEILDSIHTKHVVKSVFLRDWKQLTACAPCKASEPASALTVAKKPSRCHSHPKQSQLTPLPDFSLNLRHLTLNRPFMTWFTVNSSLLNSSPSKLCPWS